MYSHSDNTSQHIQQQLLALCQTQCGTSQIDISPLPGAGSQRRYFRLTPQGQPSMIGTYGANVAENAAFLYLSRHFKALNLCVPDIYAVSACGQFYLQQDFGSIALLDILVNPERYQGYNSVALTHLALEHLAQVQQKGAFGLDSQRLFPIARVDSTALMWDFNYFKYSFLRIAVPELDEPALEADFQTLTRLLLERTLWGFQYRDFQSRNIMLPDAQTLAFIDYQGGRIGPLLYDAASFLYQARAGFTPEQRQQLLVHYLDCLELTPPITRQMLEQQFPLVAAFRIMQTLGAYGFRGYVQRKPHFLLSIPAAIQNLNLLAQNGTLDCTPYISELVQRLSESSLVSSYADDFEGLTLHISSVSLKKGYPEPDAQNGGGFVFDCRFLPNPGRLEAFRSKTGLDEDVKTYLEQCAEVEEFMTTVLQIIGAAVANYKERKFKHLAVTFGCTGGQHRSVYCANRLAQHFANVDGVRIDLKHREL